jgi:hypothetical protein
MMPANWCALAILIFDLTGILLSHTGDLESRRSRQIDHDYIKALLKEGTTADFE